MQLAADAADKLFMIMIIDTMWSTIHPRIEANILSAHSMQPTFRKVT